MALFNQIRSKADSTTARVIFGGIVLTFVFWGVGAGMGGTTRTLARVDGEPISGVDLQKRMRMIQRQQQFSSLNEDELKKLQANVLDEMVLQRVVIQTAKSFGIEVADREIATQLLMIDAFKDGEGLFSEELYEKIIKNEGYSKAKYEATVRDDLLYGKLKQLVTGSVLTSPIELEQMARQSLTSVELGFVRIPESSVTPAAITQTDITDFIAKEDATEEETKAPGPTTKDIYERDLSSKYNLPERVSLLSVQMTLDTSSLEKSQQQRERFAAFVASVQTDAPTQQSIQAAIDAFTAEESTNEITPRVISQPNATRPQLDASLADAAFTAESKQWTKVVETDTGAGKMLQASFVQSKAPAKEVSFEDARAEIATELLKKTRLSEAITAAASTLASSWKKGNEANEESTSSSAIPMLPEQFTTANPSISVMGPFEHRYGMEVVTGAGNSPGLVAHLDSLIESSGKETHTAGVISSPFKTDGGMLVAYLVEVKKPDSDMLESEQNRAKLMLENMRREATWNEFVNNAAAERKVERLWNPLNQ